MNSVYQFEMKSIGGEMIPLSRYQGKVLLIVNTASKCGLTYQYEGLEKLYEAHQSEGLEILGFPSNQFLKQEPGTDKEIESFCQLTYNVSFPMFSKINVNGKDTHPLYVYLKQQARGIFGTKKIKWNFTKFLVDRAGNVVKRYAPGTKPEAIERDIRSLLG